MKEPQREWSAGAPLAPMTAEVLDLSGDDHVLLRLHHARTEEVLRAELAVAGYEARPGDRVLVASPSPGDDALFVIGVLGEARRRSQRRKSDALTLEANESVVIAAPRIELRAARFELEVEDLVERAKTTRRVAGEAHASLGRSRTLVAGECEVLAERTTIASDRETTIDGERVLLG